MKEEDRLKVNNLEERRALHSEIKLHSEINKRYFSPKIQFYGSLKQLICGSTGTQTDNITGGGPFE